MTISAPEYPPTVQGNLLQISHTILATEWDVNILRPAKEEAVWNANPAFYKVTGLGIKACLSSDSRDDFTVVEADFLLDNGEATLLVRRNDPDTLEGDLYALDFMQTFQDVFNSHDHELCIASVVKNAGTRLSWKR